MRATEGLSIDLIQEFRLRKWARENYVAPALRGRNWHPIVLEEMRFRDEEQQSQYIEPALSGSCYVPLAPTETYLLDEAHDTVPEPKSMAQQANVSNASIRP